MLFTQKQSEAIRARFPALNGMVFLNSAGLTPIPTSCRDIMVEMTQDLCSYAYLKMANWEKSVIKARQTAATITGCSPEEMAFVKNTSTGVSIVASGLRLVPGDEVIINDLEFPSNVYPWLNLERKGVVVRRAKSSDGKVTPDAIAEQVTAKTKVLAISSIQYATGQRTDLATLGQMAREKGFLFFVDAIQSMGSFPMDVKKLGIHFLSAGGFKWLCGPVGSGIFFCDKEKLDDLDLTVTGWNTVENPVLYHVIDYKPKNNAQRFEEASGDYIGICGLGESMNVLHSTGIDKIGEHVVALTNYLEEKLLSRGYQILSPRGQADKSAIIVVAAPSGSTPEDVCKKLDGKKILTAPRGGGIRVSPHFFNTTEDMDQLLSALGEL
ncbi:MAG: aminotransferase class V-fold PLP-dependent enzyme [Nitrospinota bacterium]|nr:aminotransferase class V-fold PLP-dependent enzyme [Nitrospinota bacterium]